MVTKTQAQQILQDVATDAFEEEGADYNVDYLVTAFDEAVYEEAEQYGNEFAIENDLEFGTWFENSDIEDLFTQWAIDEDYTEEAPDYGVSLWD